MPLIFKNITIDTMGDQKYDPIQNIITITNHARLTLDDTVVEADSLVYYENQNQIVADGNVRILRNPISLTADKFVLNTHTGWVEVTGNAQYISPIETYRSNKIRYNLNQKTGEVGELQGLVKGDPKDFYLTGKEARLSEGTTVISSAKLTRSPRKDFPDYVFDAQKMVIKGEDIYMEKVVLKLLGIPVLYLPHMDLRGEAVPRINLTASQGEEVPISRQVEKTKEPVVSEERSNTANQSEEMEKTPPVDTSIAVTDANNAKQIEESKQSPAIDTSGATNSEKKSKRVHVSQIYQIKVNPVDKPSVITAGRLYSWGIYSDEVDLNYDTRGIFSLSDVYQIDWTKYNLTVDGKSDLNEEPKREAGITFTKKAWETKYGYWQTSLLSRWIYSEQKDHTCQGVYGGYRINYQLNPDLGFSYIYLTDLSGSDQDWDLLKEDFLVTNNFQLKSNFTYNLNVPLSPHYFMINKGYYSFLKNEWTSQVILFVREVDGIRMGFGWDFAKNILDLTFRLGF